MLVSDLILMLQELPGDTKVTVWHDGDQHEIHKDGALDYAPDCGSVMICVVNSDEYVNG